jgi:hypothetical protein
MNDTITLLVSRSKGCRTQFGSSSFPSFSKFGTCTNSIKIQEMMLKRSIAPLSNVIIIDFQVICVVDLDTTSDRKWMYFLSLKKVLGLRLKSVILLYRYVYTRTVRQHEGSRTLSCVHGQPLLLPSCKLEILCCTSHGIASYRGISTRDLVSPRQAPSRT